MASSTAPVIPEEQIDHSEPVPDEQFTPTAEDKTEALGFNLRLIYHPYSPHTVAKKIETCSAYMVTGSSLKASKLVDVPASTIRFWKNHSCWWADTYERTQALMEDELQAGLVTGLQKGLDLLLHRIEVGNPAIAEEHEYEEVVLDANGDPVRVGGHYEWDEKAEMEVLRGGKLQTRKIKKKVMGTIPVPAKELATTWAIMYDKLCLMKGKPTSISEKQTDSSRVLSELKSTLEEISRNQLKDKQLNSITGTLVENKED